MLTKVATLYGQSKYRLRPYSLHTKILLIFYIRKLKLLYKVNNFYSITVNLFTNLALEMPIRFEI